MPMALYFVLAVLTVSSVLAARRLARKQGRSPLPWMVAAATLGPLPLIPLALNA